MTTEMQIETGFLADDAAELAGFVRGGYSADCCRRSRPHWLAAIRDLLEAQGVAQPAKVAPAVLELLTQISEV